MFEKIKAKAVALKNKVKDKIGAGVVAMGLLGTLVCGNAQVFAAEGSTLTVGDLDFSPISTAVLDVISMTDIITIIAATIGAGAVFILGWFGVRKIISALKKAIFKGKFGV